MISGEEGKEKLRYILPYVTITHKATGYFFKINVSFYFEIMEAELSTSAAASSSSAHIQEPEPSTYFLKQTPASTIAWVLYSIKLKTTRPRRSAGRTLV
ncbi:hypothetical protein COLO4_06770 [Corchorus olitorius]|uniref:Uncharacterized protein n=1 Tax=Corchorus olitorius TaxID=93759 RepID=A0A1R3KM16_9ROSI|nr:hypothetical protein COLO4_06770 [Corchorus olitorius]